MNKFNKMSVDFCILYLWSRLLKITANLLKILSYPFHFIFPHKRFTIPEYSKALLKSKHKTKIPQVLFQTNFTNRVTLPVYLNYLCNRIMSPTFAYRFFTTEKRLDSIRDNFSEKLLNSYKRVKVGAAQADIWRIAVLYHFGGVYLDIDAHLIRPLLSIIKPNDCEIYLYIRNNEITNYFLASEKGNKNFQRALDLIIKNIDENKLEIFAMTGPGVLSNIINPNEVRKENYKITCQQGNFTNEYFQYIDKPEGKYTRLRQDKILSEENKNKK